VLNHGPENIPLHAQKLNCRTCVCELENHVGKKGLNSNWHQSLGLQKKLLMQVFLVT
jgi:hypothetical protein